MTEIKLFARHETETAVCQAAHVVSAMLGGEVAILDVKQGLYFSLNDVGARVWELAAKEISVPMICAAILEEFEVEPGQCETEVQALVNEMTERGLLIEREIVNG